MDAIDGIDLSAEAQLAEQEVLSEQRGKVRAAIAGILTDIAKWQREKIEAEKKIKSLDENIAKAAAKRQKIVEGDWSVLNENMLRAQPTSAAAS